MKEKFNLLAFSWKDKRNRWRIINQLSYMGLPTLRLLYSEGRCARVNDIKNHKTLVLRIVQRLHEIAEPQAKEEVLEHVVGG